jgi:hypothetical protein
VYFDILGFLALCEEPSDDEVSEDSVVLFWSIVLGLMLLLERDLVEESLLFSSCLDLWLLISLKDIRF